MQCFLLEFEVAIINECCAVLTVVLSVPWRWKSFLLSFVQFIHMDLPRKATLICEMFWHIITSNLSPDNNY